MSFKKVDLAHNRKRLAEHTAKARWAQSEQTRGIHLDLASRYRQLVEREARHVISMERLEANGADDASLQPEDLTALVPLATTFPPPKPN